MRVLLVTRLITWRWFDSTGDSMVHGHTPTRVRVPPSPFTVFASREPLAGLRTKSTRGKTGSPRHQCGCAELGISKE